MSNDTSLDVSMNPNGAIGSQFTYQANEDIATRQRNDAARAQAHAIAGMMRKINAKLSSGAASEAETALLNGLQHVLSSIPEAKLVKTTETKFETVHRQDGTSSNVTTTTEKLSDNDFLERIRLKAAAINNAKDNLGVYHERLSERLSDAAGISKAEFSGLSEASQWAISDYLEMNRLDQKAQDQNRHIPQIQAGMRFDYPRPTPYGDQY